MAVDLLGCYLNENFPNKKRDLPNLLLGLILVFQYETIFPALDLDSPNIEEVTELAFVEDAFRYLQFATVVYGWVSYVAAIPSDLRDLSLLAKVARPDLSDHEKVFINIFLFALHQILT